jgi:dihydrofolate reductase
LWEERAERDSAIRKQNLVCEEELPYTPRMRKVVLGLGISLDGYIARPNGDVDFLFMPKDYSMGPFFATVDTAIMGRKTLDAAVKMSGGSYKAIEKQFASTSRATGSSMKAYVLSRTLPAGERHGLVFVNQSPVELIGEIRKLPGKNIWLMGGGELAREFLKADLVDELYIGVVPVLIGEGIPLFPAGFPERKFELIENKTFSKGMIALKYGRYRAVAAVKSKKKRKG